MTGGAVLPAVLNQHAHTTSPLRRLAVPQLASACAPGPRGTGYYERVVTRSRTGMGPLPDVSDISRRTFALLRCIPAPLSSLLRDMVVGGTPLWAPVVAHIAPH